MGDIFRMLNPQTVALIGATDKNRSFGNALLHNLSSNDHIKFYPVNNRQSFIADLPCCKSILDVPEHIDLAVIVIPAAEVPQAVEDCGKAGVDGVIIVSAGFSETGSEGLKSERRIQEIGRKYNMRLIGPGSLGFMRTHTGLNATTLRNHAPLGNIAFIAHTGNFPRTLFDWVISEHIGLSIIASLGSAVDVDFGSIIDFLGSDPQTKSIILYMENEIGDVKRFISAARAFARSKPIVVLKPRALESDYQEHFTHTGMMADVEDVFNAVFRRVGMVRVWEAKDLLTTAAVLCSRNLPKGPSLAVITNSGGMGTMAANRLINSGGKLAELSSDTMKKLENIMPDYWRRGNPVNVMRDAEVERYIGVLSACLEDKCVDGVLVVYTPQDAAGSNDLAQAIIPVVKKAGKTVITAWLGGNSVKEGRELLAREDIPAYETSEDAIRAYMYMYNYEKNILLVNETPAQLSIDESPPTNNLKTMIRKICRLKKPVLTDDEAVRFLSNYGIPTVKSHLTVNVDDALKYADEIGYPVVLKISSPEILFRHDVGGIAIGINTPATLREEYGKILDRVKQNAPAASIRGVIVQKMIAMIDYELILGAKKDKTFGSVIMFGHGGVGVELFKDISVAIPPLNQTLARRLIEETNVYKMLQGYRGKPPADFRQLEELIVSFSNLVMDFPEIMEMDINPIGVVQGKAIVLDAKIVMDKCCLDAPGTYSHLVITPYPTRYVTNWRLTDGTDVVLRPIKPEDEPLEHEMFRTLSEETIRGRYYQTIKNITHMMHVRSCNIDYDREMAIVAEVKENGERRIIGIGSFAVEVDMTRCEFAIIVHDNYQGKGLAYKLLDYLIGIAQDKGLKEFFGYIEANNMKMQKLCEKLGMIKESMPDRLVKVRLFLG
ncbi:MAG: acetyl-CoA synthetase [Deltaproteobacteria bacterium HGW-Deltaproteobacteria-10]|nr:MAG: acetyl-CoA synthetase [Deltaproteobacteria bacterium HGW-Deltaproteobacteria-10]